MDHCVSLFNKKEQEKAFQIYLTDVLNVMNENLAKAFGGSLLKYRYAEILELSNKKESEKTGDEIALEVIKKAGLSVKGKKE